MKKLIILLALLMFLPINIKAKTNVYLFYGETCPHCTKEKEFLNSLDKDIEVIKYEVWNDTENQELLEKLKKLLKTDSPYVPYTIIGDKVIVGFSEYMEDDIIKNIEYCESNTCIDVMDLINKNITELPQKTPDKIDTNYVNNESDIKKIPFLGEVDIKKISLPLVALTVGLVDGFNPCAMWVLVFLISILISLKDRKKMIILGTTFLITSGFIYFLFMAAWLKITISMTSIIWLRNIIALIALTFGLYNLVNFFKTKDVGCTVTSDRKRKKIIEKIKIFTTKKSLIIGVIGMLLLAVSVNFIELACSAGLPLLFTQILAINDVSNMSSLLYMFIYILAYLFDDIIIFLIAVFTLKITGISNKYSKYSKLIGGLIMFIIGLLLLFKPEWIMFDF